MPHVSAEERVWIELDGTRYQVTFVGGAVRTVYRRRRYSTLAGGGFWANETIWSATAHKRPRRGLTVRVLEEAERRHAQERRK